jgi:predicted GNAT superfamily acetyltransferase
VIRDARESDFGQILALNAESVNFLSPLDEVRLRHLHDQAAYHRVVDDDGTIGAFLLAFREGADYDSPNYAWFAREYPQFLYIDRIVVSMIARGRGLGAQLYNDIIAFASQSRIDKLTCEFDIDPPNPASAKFHAYFGFREVGRQRIGDGKKEVSLQVRPV